jgi:DNA-binding transcriptional MocR family regulator
VNFSVPRGGQVLWIEFPKGTDTKKPLEAAKQQGIIYNAGADWSVEPKEASNFIRLCYANPSEEAIREGIGKLAQVFHEEIGIP